MITDSVKKEEYQEKEVSQEKETPQDQNMSMMLGIHKTNPWGAISTLVLCVLGIYLVMWMYTGITPKVDSYYNSYALQAESWLHGRLDLGQNYSNLEIAIYQGKYYISFPPFPSFVLLPFVILFGTQTPDHLITVVIGILGAIYALRIALLLGRKESEAIFWALFATVGSNFVFFGFNGWVWFMAQTMSFTFCLAAIYYALTANMKTHPWLALFFLAAAVGCRPFQIIYFPVLAYLLVRKVKKNAPNVNLLGMIKKYWHWAIPTLVLAFIYIALNVMRFDQPLEFGHNYLPEFSTGSKQFELEYIQENVKRLLRLPQKMDSKMIFPKYDGVAFWLVSPIFVSLFIYFIRALYGKEKRIGFLSYGFLGLMVLHLLLICAHKTLGGWHFGNRYTVDVIPFAFLFLMTLIPEKSWFKGLDFALFLFGLVLNIVGSISVYNNWV